MNDDLGKKIAQVADLLGQEGLPDNLKGLLGMLASSNPKQDTSTRAVENSLQKEDRSSKGDLDENLEMVRRIKTVMDKLHSSSDPRINLLTAIKPFLSNKRQKRLGDCIKIINVSSMARLLDDNDKINF